MRDLIKSISKHVHKDIIIQYLNEHRVDHRKIEWEKSEKLLPLEIERVLNKLPKDDKYDILQDLCRVQAVAINGILFTEDLPTWIKNDYEAAFWCLVYRKDLFSTAEDKLFNKNPHKKLMLSILTNGWFFGGLILISVLIINLAMALSSDVDFRYIYLNGFHFVMGCLVAFFGYEYDRRKDDI